MTKLTAKTLFATVCTTAVLGMAALPAHAGKTVDAIKARGQLICGVNTGLAGFSAADSQGNWTRSEERRVGKECATLCRSRWSPYH